MKSELLTLPPSLHYSMTVVELNRDQRISLALLNNTRADNNLALLTINQSAQRKAQAWAEKLATEEKLYHSNLREGLDTCWHKLNENVGNARTISKIHELWWSSTAHRECILNANYKEIGIGVKKAHNGHYYVAHVFVAPC